MATPRNSAGDRPGSEPNLLQWERARSYVSAVGVPDGKRESAAAQIARLLVVAEESQGELFEYLQKPKKRNNRKDMAAAERKLAAAVLRDPTNTGALRAAFMAGPRISSIIPELVANPTLSWDIRGAVIKTARDFAVLAQALRTPYMEMAKVAFLNRDGAVLHSEILSIGSVTSALLSPMMVARALQRLKRPEGSQRVLLSHNHPSGVTEPSAPDVQITRIFNDACKHVGYEFVDHIITNGDTFFSFREAGFISAADCKYTSRAQPEATGRDVNPGALGKLAPWEVVGRSELAALSRIEAVASIYNALRQVDETAAYILILNRKNKLMGLERVTEFTKRPDVEGLKRKIYADLGREGGAAFIVTLPDGIPSKTVLEVTRSLRDWGKGLDAECLDLFHPSFEVSARSSGLMEEQGTYRRATVGAKRTAKPDASTEPLRKYMRAADRIAKRATKGELSDNEVAIAIAELAATLDGPGLTGVPLRVDTEKYVAGAVDRDAVIGRVRDHLVARQERARRSELNLTLER